MHHRESEELNPASLLEPATEESRPTVGDANDVVQGVRDPAAVSVEFANLPVITSKRWYITLSAAIGIVCSIASATYFIVDYVRIRPIEKDLTENQVLLTNARSDVLSVRTLLERAEQRSSELSSKFAQASSDSTLVSFGITESTLPTRRTSSKCRTWLVEHRRSKSMSIVPKRRACSTPSSLLQPAATSGGYDQEK